MRRVSEINEQEEVRIRAWIRNWRELGSLLEEIRAQEIRTTDTLRAMEMLDGMFTHAVESMPARETSGLIEQQAIFARARRR